MNIYRREFVAHCPNNDKPIKYRLEIQTEAVIMVEDIVAATELAVEKPYHESLADRFFEMFGGRQIMTAHHHGVDIETTRP